MPALHKYEEMVGKCISVSLGDPICLDEHKKIIKEDKTDSLRLAENT